MRLEDKLFLLAAIQAVWIFPFRRYFPFSSYVMLFLIDILVVGIVLYFL